MEQQPHIDAPVSFDDSTVAFEHMSDAQVNFVYWVFKLMNNATFTRVFTGLAEWAIKWRLPVKWAAKPTVFAVFCGGETVDESKKAIAKLGKNNIGSILDYSVEGQSKEAEFAKTERQIIGVIELGKVDVNVPVACIKVSGLASNTLLEKLSSKEDLTGTDRAEATALHERFERICQAAHDANVPLYVDAEESWIQEAIDRLVESMMARFNSKRAMIFQTIQMFRHDRYDYYQKLIERSRQQGFRVGVKIVRGAYLDKENNRAMRLGYPTPIQPSKAATDKAYNDALKLSVENIDWVEICAGTHNEYSTLYLTKLMKDHGVANNHPHIWFSQLYSMSDYMSFKLAKEGYNVSKYLPFGPVRSTLPYLIRRAKENTSTAGQMSKEFSKISAEKARRKKKA